MWRWKQESQDSSEQCLLVDSCGAKTGNSFTTEDLKQSVITSLISSLLPLSVTFQVFLSVMVKFTINYILVPRFSLVLMVSEPKSANHQ